MNEQNQNQIEQDRLAKVLDDAKILVPSYVELDTTSKPTVNIEPPPVEEPVKSDLMWLHPIELIKGLFSSRKD